MSSIKSGAPAPRHATHNGQTVARRKVRKGTFSCWECKRRKTRCQFLVGSDSICSGCRRHGVQCVSQEIEDPSENGTNETENQLIRVEALVNQLQHQRKTVCWKERNSQLIWNPCSEDALGDSASETTVRAPRGPKISRSSSRSPTIFPSLTEDKMSICSSLNDYLERFLPHSATATQIIACGQSPFAVVEQATSTTKFPATSNRQRENRNPIVMAQNLILLALCLRRLSFNSSGIPDLRLDAPNHAIARRFVDAARQVTCRDFLVASPEGIETLMLLSSFETNVGDWQSAWLNIRRASSFAQVIDRTRNAGQANDRMKMIHIRLILFERALSLMLGVPSALGDDIFTTERSISGESAIIKLEHIHSAVSGRIITRNRRMQKRLQQASDPSDVYDDYKETQDIDHELKQAMRFLSADRWNYTTMPTNGSDAAAFGNQIRHYDLLVLIHQPYLFHGAHRKPLGCTVSPTLRGSSTEYSKFAAVSASREVLSRVLVCCNNRQIRCSLSGLSHKAFNSSITLLLAHVEGHALGMGNVLDHQRPGDRKMVLEVVDHMEEISRSNEIQLSGWTTHVVQGLLEVEEEAANGQAHVASTEESLLEMDNGQAGYEIVPLQFSLPYFGTITVKRQQMDIARLVDPIFAPDYSLHLGFTPATMSDSSNEPNVTGEWIFPSVPAEDSWLAPLSAEATGYIDINHSPYNV